MILSTRLNVISLKLTDSSDSKTRNLPHFPYKRLKNTNIFYIFSPLL